MVMAMSYALDWFKKAEQRREENQAHAKAVHEMIALDRKAGITTSMSDGLD
jgi:LAS superfamily LD-carboxypeptidase LdcB